MYTIYNLDDPRFREFLANKWFRGAYPDPNISCPNRVDGERLANPSHETLTVEWFVYLASLIKHAAALQWWDAADEDDRAWEAKLRERYNRDKLAALKQGYQFSKTGYVTPPVALAAE